MSNYFRFTDVMLTWPHLSAPHVNPNLGGEPRYSGEFIFDPALCGIDWNVWNSRVAELVAQHCPQGAPAGFGYPRLFEAAAEVAKGDEKWAAPQYQGKWVLVARSKSPVGCADQNSNPIKTPQEIAYELYSGCIVDVVVDLFYWPNNKGGISAGLLGVQKKSDGERIGGGPPSVMQMFGPPTGLPSNPALAAPAPAPMAAPAPAPMAAPAPAPMAAPAPAPMAAPAPAPMAAPAPAPMAAPAPAPMAAPAPAPAPASAVPGFVIPGA